MNHWKLSIALAGGLLVASALPAAAQPVEQCPGPFPTTCVQINGGGASAATLFMVQVPLTILDQAPNLPIQYINGVIGAITANRLHVWTGTRGGTPTVIRYSASGSADGVRKLQHQPHGATPPHNSTYTLNITDSEGFMPYLDHTNLAGCTLVDGDPVAPGTQPRTRPSDGFQFWQYTGCTFAAVNAGVHLGASDTHAASFHQTGPSTVTVLPQDQSLLTSVQAAIVPFKIVLGKAVKRDTGSGLVNVDSLSRLEIEGLLSRNISDWSQIGLVGDLNEDGVADASAPTFLCLRQAGSGTKAALDETTMKDTNETSLGLAATALTHAHTTAAGHVHFGVSTQDMQDCLSGANGRAAHPLAIAYWDADAPIPDGPDANTDPDGYVVKLNGLLANDPSLSDPKKNVKCGQYYYWVGERLNYRNDLTAGGITTAQDGLILAFVTSASTPATIALLPAADFWVAPVDMYVTKTNDAGPISWKAGAHPC